MKRRDCTYGEAVRDLAGLRAGALAMAVLAALAGCAVAPSQPSATPRPTAAPVPVASTPGVVIRYFDGVLVLPADWVFDGTALPGQVRFQGPGGALRLGTAAQFAAYRRQAELTAQHQDTVCGLHVLRHGDGEPALFLLSAGDAFALAHDRDETVIRRLLETYCASVEGPAP